MKLTDMFELCYCLNLDERTDRWELAQKEFEKIGVTPQRFSAIRDDNPAFGCLKSHIEMLRIADKEGKGVFIFEDDVEFLDGAKEVIEKAVYELTYEATAWGMFYLGGNILKPFEQVTEHLALLNHCQSTHAYGIHKDHVRGILTFLERNSFFIDVLYAEGIIPAINSYITVPMVAIQRSDYSDIEKHVMTYDVPIARYNQHLIPLTKS